MLTYRYRGHSMSDPAKYRTREEVQKMRTEHDPIEQVRVRMLEKKIASEDELKKIDAEVRDIVNEAAEFATNDPEPDAAELWTDVYRLDAAWSVRIQSWSISRSPARSRAGSPARCSTLRTLRATADAAGSPLAGSRRLAVRARALKGAAAGQAALVNKALVAFLACLMVAFAAFRCRPISTVSRSRVRAMPIEVLMPALSPTMEKGNLAKWLKKRATRSRPAT